jgi:hypothetical protein
MTREERIAEFEADNAVLREQVQANAAVKRTSEVSIAL